uniref:hypothetical protein n=1 Tax=uncultured Sphingomonas sp. TaxID=158754 RepID=UPI0035CA1ACD
MMVDTLTIARELKATELPAEQAEAIAAAIGRSVAEGSATKADLETVRVSLKSDIDNVWSEAREMESHLIAKIEAGHVKLIMWFIGTQIAFIAIMSAIIKL